MNHRRHGDTGSDDLAERLAAMMDATPAAEGVRETVSAPRPSADMAVAAVGDGCRPRQSGRWAEPGDVRRARATIPLCLVLAVLLPLLTVGWHAATPGSAYRVGEPWLPWAMMALALLAATGGAAMMIHVARWARADGR